MPFVVHILPTQEFSSKIQFLSSFSQSIKRAIYNRTNYIHLHTLQVEDEKFVQICGKSLFWHADSSKSSDYLPLSYQSHFQFHLDHILSSYLILTIQWQYLICSFFHLLRSPHFFSNPLSRGSLSKVHTNHI